MRKRTPIILLLLLVSSAMLGGCQEPKPAGDGPPKGWGASDSWLLPSEGGIDPADFVEGVDHPYWPLAPGTTWIYEADTPDGTERIEVVVLEEPRTVMGIECVVVRDTVTLDGELIEDTYDWYAQDTAGNVWYMGEDSKEYEAGEFVGTAGSWEAGVAGAMPGIKVWAEPRLGDTPYYQEFFEGEAEDLARDVRDDVVMTVLTGEYDNVLVVEEWTPLDPGYVELKYYAPGIGTVKEEMVRGGDEVVELLEFRAPGPE